jgi:hypothetical protein
MQPTKIMEIARTTTMHGMDRAATRMATPTESPKLRYSVAMPKGVNTPANTRNMVANSDPKAAKPSPANAGKPIQTTATMTAVRLLKIIHHLEKRPPVGGL